MKRVNIYKKMTYMYIMIIVSLILVLDIFFIALVFKNTLNNNLYINEKIGNEVNNGLIKMSDYSNSIINTMYSDHNLMNDVSNFLNMNTVTYLKNKLDTFSGEDAIYFNGVEKFVKNGFLMNEDINSITFVSYPRNEISIFNNKNQIKVEQIKEMNEIDKLTENNVMISKDNISFTRNITNPKTFKLEGKIIITYNLNKFNKLVDKYDDNYELILLDQEGKVFYDSREELNYEKYKYYEKIKTGDLNDKYNLENEYYVYKVTNKLGVTVISKFLAAKIMNMPKGYMYSIIFIDALVLIVAIFIYINKLRKLNKRTDRILFAMEKVKTGELDIKIDTTNDADDEVKEIAENFNSMCKELNTHIEKSYMAEIKRKKAELNALQSQINPHFLYNTLEGIRMKAVCNGDKEVGKMLYSLAFLFRSQIKDNERIYIKNEIEYCKKYIEIFKFRYEEVFEFNVNCEEEIKGKEIIKFSLQPLIENYFVHGIRLDKKDNYLEINIFKKDKEIIVEIIDNGKGISKERMGEINKCLEGGQAIGKSIGISNANERIKIAYGEMYGIKIKRREEQGVKVIVNIPCKEVE
ncbi:MAG: sensor histidine kinase [Clostridium sp.]